MVGMLLSNATVLFMKADYVFCRVLQRFQIEREYLR